MVNPKFELFKSPQNSQYYFRLRASNGEPVLSSEGYTLKQNCFNGIASVKANAPYDSRYSRKDGFGNYTFNLHAPNGEIIGRSENYKTSQAREVGVAAVKKDATNAPLQDLT